MAENNHIYLVIKLKPLKLITGLLATKEEAVVKYQGVKSKLKNLEVLSISISSKGYGVVRPLTKDELASHDDGQIRIGSNVEQLEKGR